MDDRRVRTQAAAVVLMVLFGLGTFVTTTAAGAATMGETAQGATWQLVDYRQSGCFDANVHDTYYGIYINGRWRSPVDVGAEGLPVGGSYTTSYAPIPPGSSDGEFSLAYVHVTLAPNPPIGRYTAWMWGSDGRTAQQVPIFLDVRARCGY